MNTRRTGGLVLAVGGVLVLSLSALSDLIGLGEPPGVGAWLWRLIYQGQFIGLEQLALWQFAGVAVGAIFLVVGLIYIVRK